MVSTMLMTGEMGIAGTARPRTGRSQNVCGWSVIAPKATVFVDPTTHYMTTRRQWESSQ
jgi:hypothetical protein